MTLKNYLIAIGIMLVNTGSYAQQAGKTPPPIYNNIEQMPRPDYDMSKYLSENLAYPDSARSAGIEGRVVLKFIVDEEGKITDAQVMKGIGGGCDQEAVRVVEKMPAWNPGRDHGKPVKVYFMLPINFKLTDEDTKQPEKTSNTVDQKPVPPADLQDYIKNNMHYPDAARSNKVEGKVMVRFAIDKDGSISDATVVHGIGNGCDEEALRVIKSMPRWTPAVKDGKPVKIYYNVPLVFKL